MAGPAYHGRTHLPGGTDPIPGLELGSGGSGDFSGYVLSLSDLVGYWRLGEGAAPFADTSGQSPAADLDKIVHTFPMDEDVVGALPGGQDDGAVEFTGTAYTNRGDYLIVSAGATRFHFTTSAYTVSAWAKLDSAGESGSNGVIVGTHQSSNFGWALVASWPGQTISHIRQATGGSPLTFATGPGVAADEWVFVVATWDPTTGHQLFYNAALVDTDPGTTTVPTGTLRIGGNGSGSAPYGGFTGAIDEVAIWSRVLTEDEIDGLYTNGGPDAEASPDGEVLTADGSGGTYWALPTYEVLLNGS